MNVTFKFKTRDVIRAHKDKPLLFGLLLIGFVIFPGLGPDFVFTQVVPTLAILLGLILLVPVRQDLTKHSLEEEAWKEHGYRMLHARPKYGQSWSYIFETPEGELKQFRVALVGEYPLVLPLFFTFSEKTRTLPVALKEEPGYNLFSARFPERATY